MKTMNDATGTHDRRIDPAPAYRLDKTAFSIGRLETNPTSGRFGSPRPLPSGCAPPSFFGKVFMATTLLHSDFKEFLKLLHTNHVVYLMIAGRTGTDGFNSVSMPWS